MTVNVLIKFLRLSKFKEIREMRRKKMHSYSLQGCKTVKQHLAMAETNQKHRLQDKWGKGEWEFHILHIKGIKNCLAEPSG